jgi:chromatin segregation and condensation protein Rec8/ScpA/Scc1 (kleisin family)
MSSPVVVRKPFYMRPPWNILFDVSRLEKLAPWNVNIAYLLRSFLLEMDKMGKIDFRASGVALDSSALIYLMKSKLLLTLQEPPAPPKGPMDVVPPPLFLPLRHELTSTTIQHLLEVLNEVLSGEKPVNIDRTVLNPVLPQAFELMPQFDQFIAELQTNMDKLYARLVEMVKGLGLTTNGLISLWQNEETEEIYIAVGNLKIAEIEQRRSKPET